MLSGYVIKGFILILSYLLNLKEQVYLITFYLLFLTVHLRLLPDFSLVNCLTMNLFMFQ